MGKGKPRSIDRSICDNLGSSSQHCTYCSLFRDQVLQRPVGTPLWPLQHSRPRKGSTFPAMSVRMNGSQLTIEQLKRRFSRLQQLQRRLRLPAAAHFEAPGRQYHLPLRVKHAQACRHMPQRTLDYLAGFFDGDGCVSPSADSTRIRLAITQTESSSTVLLLFRNLLGGSVMRGDHTKGLIRPTLQWEVSGEAARHAAALLCSRSSCKDRQLSIASSWPQTLHLRAEAVAKLKVLKRKAPPTATCPTWHYLAGFFDAEGCIHLQQPSYIRLKITQKFPQVLRAIQKFLAEHGLKCSISNDRTCASLVISETELSKLVLARLVVSGLRLKREAARLALRMTSDNFLEIRSDLQKMVGNQGRYQRLTCSGLERAKEINRLRARLRWAGPAGPQNSALESQLRLLCEDHKLQRAQERLLLIRSDIRHLLSQGANSV